jgi:hypothetical protein
MIAMGAGYLGLALNAVSSLHRVDPSIPVTIVSNIPKGRVRLTRLHHSIVKWSEVDIPTRDNRLVKTSAPEHSPFTRTLMVDSDVEFTRSPRALFALVDGYDVVVRRAPAYRPGSPKAGYLLFDGTRADATNHWNSSVVLFRGGETAERFFGIWNAAFRRTGAPFDQISLVEALRTSGVNFRSIDGWNEAGETTGGVIKHYTNRMSQDVERRCRAIAITCLRGSDRQTAIAEIRSKTQRRSVSWNNRRKMIAWEVRLRRRIATFLALYGR